MLLVLNLYEINVDLQNKCSDISKNARDLIKAFYHEMANPNEDLGRVLEQWKKEFQFIYGDINGNFSSNKKIKPVELAELFGFEDSEFADLDIVVLFLACQTYLSLLLKLISHRLIESEKPSDTEAEVKQDLKGFIADIINGSYFLGKGIENYCYQDWYSWILGSWNPTFDSKIGFLVNKLDQYDSIGDIRDFNKLHNNDYIKQIYETIIPKQLRHALGEYYTPDWLALFTIKRVLELNETDIHELSFLDPTCGSGTFLFKTIQLMKASNVELSGIVDQVIGYDINPLAVLTAKTNYIVSIIDLVGEVEQLHLPVYNFDVINSPYVSKGYLVVDLNDGDVYKIPVELVNTGEYRNVLRHLAVSLENRNRDHFAEYIEKRFGEDSIALLLSLYERLSKQVALVATVTLNTLISRIDGYMRSQVDIIIGNPPWVNWEYLPRDYREKSQNLWVEYGIFSVTGRDLAFSKEDISVLITYLVIDKYLKDEGMLGFVIRQGLFKSAQNGVGFRKFRVRENGYDIGVLRVDDLSNIQPFDDATNSTAIMFVQKNRATVYPVPYYLWRKKRNSRGISLDSYSELYEVLAQMDIHQMIAKPAVKDDMTSMWITGKREALDAIERVLGKNEYRARTGVFTGGANAVYWLRIKEKQSNGNIVVSNITERAKRKVDDVVCEIEPDLVYPLVQGSDLQVWTVNTKSYILCPHTAETKMVPIDENIMRQEYPLTYDYLLQFRTELDERKGFAGWEKQIQEENFYAILRIGEYTFSKFKVAWRYIASEFITAVITEREDSYLGNKLLVPNEKIMYIGTDCEEEAYYLCGMLSSAPVGFAVKSYMNPTSISTHVLEKLNIPTFDNEDQRHLAIADLCKQGHEVASEVTRSQIMNELNQLVAEIYQISKEEIEIICSALSY